MKNCLEFVNTKLTGLLVTLGVFQVIDVLKRFDVVGLTSVITLDKHYLKTEDVTKIKYGAVKSEHGYLNLKAQSDLVKMLLQIICNPGSPEEVIRINTALKSLVMKVDNNTRRFYELLAEGMHRRMMFNKLSQIYGPLAEEIKINNELLIMLINNKLIDLNHLNEVSYLTDGNEQATRISHYLIHNVNHHERLRNFLFIIQGWTRDWNLVEDLEEITFDIEMFQCKKIEEKIHADMSKGLCELY